jgi:hypothetical protein
MMRTLYKNLTVSDQYVGGADHTGTLVLDMDWSKFVKALAFKAANNRTGKTGISKLGIKARFVQRKGV